MSSMKKAAAGKAVTWTARHTAHGTASKLKREPVRASTLLGLGCLLGAAAGWALSRACASGPAAPAGGPA